MKPTAEKDPVFDFAALPELAPDPAPVKRGRGRPAGSGGHKPTAETRAIVERCCGSNWSHNDIARLLGISDETLRKYYREELDRGKGKCLARVEMAVIQVASDPDHRDFATMAKFFLKSKSNWTETSRIEHTGADGAAIQSQLTVSNVVDSTKLSVDQRQALREILAAASRPSALIDQKPEEINEVEDEGYDEGEGFDESDSAGEVSP
jgi:transposase-like protein